MDLLKIILQNKKDIEKLKRCISCQVSGQSSDVIQFRVGDGGAYTPANGSSTFNPINNPLVGKQVTAIFASNLWVPPTGLTNTSELSWSFDSITGIITLSNGTFNTDTIYAILY